MIVSGLHLVLAVILLLLPEQILAKTLEYNLVVERTVVNLDGVIRDALTVNRQPIGPTIVATVGDNLLISVTNMCLMQEVVSMHWHGINQIGTPWSDGAAFVTNCPITFGSSYKYNFTVDSPGTYWYHAHIGSQREEGANGMIVVHTKPSADSTDLVQTPSRFGALAFDEELHVVLTDRFNPSVFTLTAMVDNNPYMKAGKPDAVYINGKGESKFCSYNGTSTTLTSTSSDGTTSSVTTTCKGQREVFSLDRNKTYLVRVVNAAFMAFFNLAVAGHYFTIVGVDGGTYTKPVDANSLDLSSGQRVVALLRFNQSAVEQSGSPAANTFVMQARTEWEGNDNSHGGYVHAYVTYGNASKITSDSVSPLVPPNESRNWHEWYDLVTPHPAVPNTCPGDHEVTKRFQVDGKVQYTDIYTGEGLTPPSIAPGVPNTRQSWTVHDNARFMMPATPYLLTSYTRRLHRALQSRQYLRSPRYQDTHDHRVLHEHGQHTHDHAHFHNPEHPSPTAVPALPAMSLMNPTLQPLRVELGDVVEVVVQAYASASGGCDLHPWHLHGHSFWLVSRGAGLYDPSSAAANAFAHPLRQDTVSGYPSNHSESRVYGGTKGKWNDPCGWFVIRFRANNPGMWLFHCHIGWHMAMGMALVFDEASELVPAPPSDYGMCGAAGEIGAVSAYATDLENAWYGAGTVYIGGRHHDMAHVLFVLFLFVAAVVVVSAVCRRKHRLMKMYIENAHAEARVPRKFSIFSGGPTEPFQKMKYGTVGKYHNVATSDC